MGQNDWYRGTSWTEDDQRAFFSRLNRSRSSSNKSQYLRIQALYLQQTGSEPLVRASLNLLDMLFEKYPEKYELASAHEQAADCHDRLENIPEAIRHFRLSLEAHTLAPFSVPVTYLTFPWFVVRRELTDLYDEALRTVNASDYILPVQFFQVAAIHAIVAEHRGEHEKAVRHAHEALEAVGLRESGFRYHPDVGLVGPAHEQMIERLLKLLGR